jgi:acyl-CoA reductase-like NAD-dependent aldehyde dehydrogenase
LRSPRPRRSATHLTPEVVFGPAISQTAVERILGVIDHAVTTGAGDLLTGGRRVGSAGHTGSPAGSKRGSVWINQFSDIFPQGPYGGYKQSGFGRTGGLEGSASFYRSRTFESA